MSAKTTPWKVIWVTGASTGIGRDLAVKLAQQGATVVASARSADKLADLAKLHASIVPVPVDVTDLKAVRTAAAHIRSTVGEIDLAILNAGVWQPLGARGFEAERTIRSMDVNYNGVVHSLDAILAPMIARGKGHLALVSSVAAYRGLPKGVAYAPTKAAVIALAESLKHDLDRMGLTISVINPGFVDTPMTKINKFPMPFLITSDEAADRMISGLKKGKYEIAFPWQTNALMKLARFTPNRVFFWFVRTFLTPPG